MGNPELDPLHPPAPLLVKLGSMARHWQEFCSPNGHAFDESALNALLDDPEVKDWMVDETQAISKTDTSVTDNAVVPTGTGRREK